MTTSPLRDDAIAGVTHPGLIAALAEHWEWLMRWSPTYATTLGDHRYDHTLAPRDRVGLAACRSERDVVISQLAALEGLDAADRTTCELLRGQLEAQRDLDACHLEEWSIDSGAGSVFGELSYLVELHVVSSDQDAANLVSRMRQGAKLVDDTVAALARGLAKQRVAARGKVIRAIEQLDTALARPTAEWEMAKPAWAATYLMRAAELRHVVFTQLLPAFTRQRDFLRDRVLPAARTELEGVSGLPDGDAIYKAAIDVHVGIPRTPQELHALGLAEIAKTDAAIARLGASALGTADLAATITRLRTDPKLYFATRDEIVAAAQDQLDRANAATPRFFSVLPKTPCVMREIPAYEAPYTTIAYYRQPHYDGSKPGEYFVNTYKPETRARYELEALTWHESVPGHHLQIAIAMELGALPAFRKLDGSTAFVEGWALYTERLADEMGLYTADLDRLGAASYEAWRASRLVVDTGLHAMGWTRAQAEQYMRDHTALTEVNIVNEVDRYIGWPGQALAYKVGQLEIVARRAEAEAALGKRFDLKGFHAVVLGAGAVTLPVLDRRVREWIAAS